MHVPGASPIRGQVLLMSLFRPACNPELKCLGLSRVMSPVPELGTCLDAYKPWLGSIAADQWEHLSDALALGHSVGHLYKQRTRLGVAFFVRRCVMLCVLFHVGLFAAPVREPLRLSAEASRTCLFGTEAHRITPDSFDSLVRWGGGRLDGIGEGVKHVVATDLATDLADGF